MAKKKTASNAPAEGDGLPDAAAQVEVSQQVEAAEEDRIDQELPVAVEPAEIPANPDLSDPALYFNRELSWIDFNWRVFFQAIDPRTPLLERVRFIAITANNLDEFYRKRVGGLKRQLEAGVRALSPDGRTPREQLDLSLAAARHMQFELCRVWETELRPELADAGVVVREYDSLEDEEQAALDTVFRDTIFPILTPLAVDSGHPFPFISNLSLSLAFTLRHPNRQSEHFARLKVPTVRGRFLPVDGTPGHVVAVEDVIRNNAEELFRGMEVEGGYAFRVTRNASLDRSEEEADDLLEMISEELRERKFSEVVRLEVEDDMPLRVQNLLRRELDLHDDDDVVEVDGMLDLAGIDAVAGVDRPDLKDLPWESVVPIRLRHTLLEEEDDMFAVMRQGDLLVHHPYESFAASTQRFIEEAAEDPRVLAIKLTVYRTSQDSPIVRALIRAAEAGKQVAALVELKARFDEEKQHRVGAAAGARRRPRRLRAHRPQDPRQDHPRRARGGERAAHLRAPRDGQLQPHDRPLLHRLRAVHQPGGHRRGPGGALPLPDRLRARAGVPDAGGRPARLARQVRRAHPPRDRPPAGRQEGADHR